MKTKEIRKNNWDNTVINLFTPEAKRVLLFAEHLEPSGETVVVTLLAAIMKNKEEKIDKYLQEILACEEKMHGLIEKIMSDYQLTTIDLEKQRFLMGSQDYYPK